MTDMTTQEFRDDLLFRRSEKRAKSLEAERRRREMLAKTRERYATSELFRQILEQLNKLQTLIKLKQPPPVDGGPVTFVINERERDEDGEIRVKAFTVQR